MTSRRLVSMASKNSSTKSLEPPLVLARKLTWNLKITPLERKIIFKPYIFRFHVSFRGCNNLLRVAFTKKGRAPVFNSSYVWVSWVDFSLAIHWTSATALRHRETSPQLHGWVSKNKRKLLVVLAGSYICITGGWFQPIGKIWVKMGIFPK